MKTILCYGDSNTWGYIPGNLGRYSRGQCWAGVMQAIIGEFCVIEEGLCGRYTVHDEPYRQGRSGASLLQSILESHKPVDLLMLFLGTNDILHFKELGAFDVARGV